MFSLQKKVLKYFGPDLAESDVNKSSDPENMGRGTEQRYHESLASDTDDNIIPLIENFVGNHLDPNTVLSKFLVYLEDMMGIQYLFFNTDSGRRKVLRMINRLYDIKGTKRGYRVMLYWFGFDNVEIIEHSVKKSFDSQFTLDDNKRVFDQACYNCGEYTIALQGNVVISSEVLQQIINVVEFNEPINSELRDITLNGQTIVQEIITVYVSDGTDGNRAGDLIYNNTFDPNLLLRIATKEDELNGVVGLTGEVREGDMIMSGDNSDKYFKTPSGDLVYVFAPFYHNNCVLLDGISKHVEYAHIPEYSTTGNESVSFGIWVKFNSASGVHDIMSKGGDGVLSGFRLYKNSLGKIVLYAKNVDGFVNEIASDNTFSIDEWYNIVCVIDDENSSNWNLYVNGVDEPFTVVLNGFVNSSSTYKYDISNIEPIRIGRTGSNYGDVFVDTVFYSKKRINQEETKALYNDGEGQHLLVSGISDLLLESTFDETNSTTIFDGSTNQNHATFVNGLGNETDRVPH